jgi:hypothetical protein
MLINIIGGFSIMDLPYCQDCRNDPFWGAAEELAVPLGDFPNKNYKEAREVRKEADNLRPEDQEDDNHRLEDQVAAGIVAAQAVVKNTVEGQEDLETHRTWALNHTSNPAMSLSLGIQGKTLMVARQIVEPVSPHMWKEIGPASPCSCLSTNLRLSHAQFL